MDLDEKAHYFWTTLEQGRKTNIPNHVKNGLQYVLSVR